MQPQANRDRIIIRTSLMPTLPPVVADERSMRQIVLNLLSNSIKFTGAGGQVIVSTALTDQGEAILRVRDTGIGMSEKEIATAMEPFRQVVSSGRSDMAPGSACRSPRRWRKRTARASRSRARSTPARWWRSASRRHGYWRDKGVPCARTSTQPIWNWLGSLRT